MENPVSTEELFVQNAVHWLRLAVESTGAVVIGIGVSIALVAFARSLLARRPSDFNAIRLVLARYRPWPWSSNSAQTFSRPP